MHILIKDVRNKLLRQAYTNGGEQGQKPKRGTKKKKKRNLRLKWLTQTLNRKEAEKIILSQQGKAKRIGKKNSRHNSQEKRKGEKKIIVIIKGHHHRR